MIRVAVSGAGGKLAGPIIEAIVEADDLELSSLYNPRRAGAVVSGVTLVDEPGQVSGDVLVETAHPDVVFKNLEAWRDLGIDVVVGTSGFTPQRLSDLKGMWGVSARCLIVPNFSIGAVLMMRFAREAAPHFEAVEIIERHHSTKPDAPSGTSLATAMGVAGVGGSSSTIAGELVEGARGADVDGVRVHSVRLPGLIAQQEVVLSNAGEVLSVEHLSTSYQSFAAGALLAVRKIGDLPAGVHLGLESIL